MFLLQQYSIAFIYRFAFIFFIFYVSQSDMTSTDIPSYSHTLFPSSNPPQNDYSAFSKPSGSSHTVTKKSINPPNTVDIFKRLISEVSTGACRSESSPCNTLPGLRSFSSVKYSGPFYGQISTGWDKVGR